MKVRGLNIKYKVLIAPATILVFLLIECAFGWYALSTQKSSLREIVEVRDRAVLNAYKYIDGLDQVHLQTYRFFSWLGNADDKVVSKMGVELKQLMASVKMELKDIARSPSLDSQTSSTMLAFISKSEKYEKSILTALDMSEVDAATSKQMLQSSDDEFKRLRAELTSWSEKERLRSIEAYELALKVHENAIEIGSLLALISIVCGVAISLWFANAITVPLLKAAAIARDLSEGKVQEIDSPPVTDEASALLQSLSATSKTLSVVVSRIHHTADEVVIASNEILNSSGDLSARTERTAAALEETSASMDQLATTINETASNANSAATTAGNARDLAERSGKDITNLILKMNSITSAAKKIADITGLIDSIAFQTNILALNAAVEAARAGEHGRGFAVVASEVRSLAQRCASASKEISELIKSSVTSVNEGAQMVNTVGGRSVELVTEIANLSQNLNKISSASTDQALAVQEVKAAVFQIDRSTQENASMVQNASRTADSLSRETANLLEAVQVFVVLETKPLLRLT